MRFKKSFRKILAMAIAAGTFAAMPLASAEVKEYEGFGEYVMSDFETPDVAKQRAKARAEQNAMEQAGVYVESYTKVINAQVTYDEITTMTNGILRVKDTQYKMLPTDDGKAFLIHATIKADVDTDDVSKWLEQNKQKMYVLVEQNKELQKVREEQERKIEELQKQIANIETVQEKNELQEKFMAADQEFLSNQKMEKGHRLLIQKDYAGAVVCFLQAIELNPQNEDAWGFFRGSYLHLADERKEFYNKEKMLKQVESKKDKVSCVFCYNSGIENIRRGYSKRAISNFTEVIKIYPENIWAYYYRGIAYLMCGIEDTVIDNYNKAIIDFTKMIEIQPQNAVMYQLRGIAYHMKRDYARANEDFLKAKELGK